MSQVKYIAAGFQKDSENLLKEFLKENSTNFSVFCTKWKEHNFNLIFAGRDEDELQQFTGEIFQVTLGYFQNNSTVFQVGAVFLLYALYRNQKSIPSVEIRITLPQWEVLRKLKALSEKNCYMHLHYIINFLCTKAFDFVADGSMFGPICSKGKTEIERSQFIAPFSLEDSKKEMKSFSNSNLLGEIETLTKEYVSLGKKYKTAFFEKEKRHLDISRFSNYINDLNNLLNTEPGKAKISNKSADVELGNRRAKIKANQFSRKARFRQLNASDSDSVDDADDDNDEDYKPIKEEKGTSSMRMRKHHKKKRLPKEQRRVGRPRKYNKVEKVKTDESDHGKVEPKIKLKRGRKPRGPIQRASYLAAYELKVPTFNKKIFKDFLPDSSSTSSEEEPPDCKEEKNVQEEEKNVQEEEKNVQEEEKDAKNIASDEALDIFF